MEKNYFVSSSVFRITLGILLILLLMLCNVYTYMHEEYILIQRALSSFSCLDVHSVFTLWMRNRHFIIHCVHFLMAVGQQYYYASE